MPVLSMPLKRLIERLGAIDLSGAQQEAMTACAENARDEVVRSLSGGPGGEHLTPWRRSGALSSSIAVTADASEAVVGSTDPVAVDQEMGTMNDPPRPFLAPAAQRMAPDIAAAVAQAVETALSAALEGADR